MTTQAAPARPQTFDSSPPPATMPAPAASPATAPGVIATDDDRLNGFVLDINSILALMDDDDALDDWFLPFTADNAQLGCRFEIDCNGRLIAMASESRDGAERQFNLQYDLATWTDAGAGGKVAIGNELVRISRLGRRAPDAGWIAPEQLAELPPPGQRHHALPFAPRFVAEIRSRSDTLESQQAKMEEWLASGTALGWLIDPYRRQVHIYRPGVPATILDDPETVSGDDVLPGFVFAVRQRIFDLQ